MSNKACLLFVAAFVTMVVISLVAVCCTSADEITGWLKLLDSDFDDICGAIVFAIPEGYPACDTLSGRIDGVEIQINKRIAWEPVYRTDGALERYHRKIWYDGCSYLFKDVGNWDLYRIFSRVPPDYDLQVEGLMYRFEDCGHCSLYVK